jgi:hypothetical protein
MLPNNPTTLSKQISWDFRLAAAGNVARYGTLAAARYKQYLPGGLELPGQHPPRPIEERQYQMALRQYGQNVADRR